MRSIFDKQAYTKVIERITLLSSTNEKRWGKMTLPQMLVHCTAQLRLALGEVPSQPQGSPIMRTAVGKWIAFSNIPWPKGTNTPNEMNMDRNSLILTDIENEKKDLLGYLDRIKSAQKPMPHPFFGELSREEWGRLVYKHIDHHLKQFSQ